MTAIVGAGLPGDRTYIPLATRRGTIIRNEQRLQKPPALMRAAKELWEKNRPEARLRSSTSVYNCLGMVFACRRTCIDPDELRLILDEDEYRRLSGPDQVRLGDLVIYRNPRENSVTHVGVVIDVQPNVRAATIEITVMSQWGADGEYLHRADYVPDLLGKPAEYWTDRMANP